MFIAPKHPMLQYSGRIDFDNEMAPVLIYAASFIRMKFKGSFVHVQIDNQHLYWTNYLGVIIDGRQTKIALADEPGRKTYVLGEDLGEGVHDLILFKRQDACHQFTFYGFEIPDDGMVLEPDPQPKRRIEVFGDSVSCGEVSEAIEYVGKTDPDHNGQYSNSWYSYAWMTARKLGAQLHDTSQGGIALLDGTGWFCAEDYVGMESCYDKIQYNPEFGALKDWDFSKYQPHIVIVAIGQNDNHPVDYMAEDYDGARSQNWRKHYQAFIEKLMRLYPKAQLILQTTLLMHDGSWDRSIDEVCQAIGNDRVHHYIYKRNGRGTPGHLRIPEAQEMADELAAFIEAMGEKIWRD